MFSTILLVIFAVLVVVGGVLLRQPAPEPDRFGNTPDGPSARQVGGGLLGVFGVLLLVTALWTMTTIVSATEVGVPISFGRASSPITSGFHVKAPWTSIETLPVRPFPVQDIDVTARTSEAGQVTATVGARWQVIPARARDTYMQVRTGDEDKISKDIVDKALATATGNVFVTRTNILATTDRTGIEAALMVELNRIVAPYGITVPQVFLRKVEPDAKTADSLARVAAQQRETTIATESIATATAQAKARLAEALGLQQAAAAIPAVSPAQASALCMQSWERMAQRAIAAGVSLYTSPCGGGGASVMVGK